MGEEHESVALARRVRFGDEERVHELRGIGNEVLEFAIDGVEGEDGILPDIRMPVFETRSTRWNERF